MPGDRLAFVPVDTAGAGADLELAIQTYERFAFVDLTEQVAERVLASRLRTGVVHVHTCHTTTGLVLNENEPLLLGDLRRALERLVPEHAAYSHDDIGRRGCPPEEPQNGAAHCRALLLPSSQCLPIRQGRLALGRWQSLFLVELDGPRRRMLHLTVTGR